MIGANTIKKPARRGPSGKPRRKPEKKQYREFFIDSLSGDKMIMRFTSKRKELYLKLHSENNKRYLGTITLSTKTMELKRKRQFHLLWAKNAYGFNEYVLSNAKTFDKVWLRDEYADWKIPIKDILEKGDYLHFKGQGYERQKFMTLEQLEPYRIHKKSNRRI